MEAERRQVTILFTDMVGFTTFSEESGEEAAFRLMQDVAKLTGEAVRREGGVVQGFTGDGVMAVFGAPAAFEDAPLRACSAALGILDCISKGANDLERKFGVRPQLRIGVNTGLAVVGEVQDGAAGGVTVMGDTVNVAARLQALANPGTIFLTEATRRLAEGQIDAEFVGEHQLKGKAEPLKLYKLTGLRRDTTRFAAIAARGLSSFVGRRRELEVLEQNLAASGLELRVVDIVADAGMGKSRLVYEFRQRLMARGIFVLSGSCSPDGKQTSFLPFIEVVRGAFQLTATEPESDIARKLSAGLTRLERYSPENLALLLNLLGLSPPEGSLAGLDGLLIGLRTRDLLLAMLNARSQLTPLALLIEDLHWIDSASEELLGKIVGADADVRMLVLLTRRPEYQPAWSAESRVANVPLQPLPAEFILQLVQARLGVAHLPERLEHTVIDRADGNALFAEEIVTFLIERGLLKVAGDRIEFAPGEALAVLPSSVQSLLTARVDQLPSGRRALLQAASVIGRRFDPVLLAAVTDGRDDIQAALSDIEAFDLAHPVAGGGGYEFKHALVRDALYQSLLTTGRANLHLKIAQEIERRSDNRLNEVAEILAHHYSLTEHADKAFTYLFMAGAKSLSVYSLDEATNHFAAARQLVDDNPDCASYDQVADFIVSYTLLLNVSAQWNELVKFLERYLPVIDRLGNHPRAVLIRHHYVFALISNMRHREAASVQQETLRIAQHLGDSKSRAYALAGELNVSTLFAPKSQSEFETLKRELMTAAFDTDDAYIQHWTGFMVVFEEYFRGRLNYAIDAIHDLVEVGRRSNDPRSTGLGLAGLTWIAFATDALADALDYSEQALAIAVTPYDRSVATSGKGIALVLNGQIEAGVRLLEQYRRGCAARGEHLAVATTDGVVGVAKVLQGKIGEGIRSIEEAVLRQEKDGSQTLADWDRLTLAEVYLQVITGTEKPPFAVVFKNLPTLAKIVVSGPSRIRALVAHVLENPRFDPAGIHTGRAHMILGLLYRAKKKRALALEHLTQAKQIVSKFALSPMVARIDAALAELSR